MSYILEILGGLFWIGLMYLFAGIINMVIIIYFLPENVREIYTEHTFAIFNTLFSTVMLIFKTTLYHEKTAKVQRPADFIPDYTQF